MPAKAATAWTRSPSAGSAGPRRASRTSRTRRRRLGHAARDADRTRRLLRDGRRRRRASGCTPCSSRAWRPSTSRRFTRRWSGRCRACWRAWSGAASRSTSRSWPRCRTTSARSRCEVEKEINTIAGTQVNPGSPKQLGDILFGQLGLPGGTKTKTGQWSTGARALEELAEQGHELPQKILDWRQVSKLRSTYTDALPHLRQSADASRPHQLRAGRDLDRPPLLIRAEPAEHPDPHRGRPQDPPRLHRRAGHEARLGRLFADRAAAAVRSRRGAGAAQGVPGRHRHSRHDGVGDVRRAGREDAGRDPPPRQGDQLRHHLRHLGLRPRRPAFDSARGSRGLHQEIFRALPRHPRLHGRDARVLPRQGLCAHPVRPQMPLPRHQVAEPVDPLVQRARRHQCAPARLGRRHHPPRHDPHRGRADASQSSARRCCCRCTTN